jgi:thiol-disulfide isomerase/thioredoxin
LSVVREIDGRKVAGEMQVKPPQSNLRIELSEDRVSSVTPPLPPPPGLGPFDPKGAEPPPLPGPPPLDPPAATLHRENIAGTPNPPPTAAIRPPPSAAPTPPPARPAEPRPPESRGTSQRVPNFTVSNVLGEDWDLRSASGRLILVEFWSTTCIPCARAVPAIKRLHADYGRSGLEIVALACEPDGPFRERATAVDAVARRKEMTYKVYVDREGHAGEVQRLFGVQWVPTLVLLDRQGTVLWRGGASEPELARLDGMVRDYLSRR